jgi:hypothetical protein
MGQSLAASPAEPSVQPNLSFDLRAAVQRDPYLIVQTEVPRIYLKWYLPTFVVVVLLILWWRPPLALTPGLIEFVTIAGGAVVLVILAAYFYARGPRPRRLPIRLVLKSGGLDFEYPDGERFSLSWTQPGLWLDLGRPAKGPQRWDQKAGDFVVDESGGPAAVAARQERMFRGTVPSATLRCGGRDAVLPVEALESVLQSARHAGCRVREVRVDSWDSWLIQEPLTRPSFWSD